MTTEHSFYADNLVDALLEQGIPSESIWELNGWKVNEQGYYWVDVHTDQHHGYNGVANGHFNHHSATSAYTPYVKNPSGQTKATGWLGMRRGNRLYQNGGGVPSIALASAGPADYSAGKGVRGYVKKLDASEKALRQLARDDIPTFWGNRYVLNTEVICDGVGGSIDQDAWDLLIAYNAGIASLHDAGPGFNGFHQGFTGRKIDYSDGRYGSGSLTIAAIWKQIEDGAGMQFLEQITDQTWRTWFEETDVLGTQGNYRYYSKNDGTVDFVGLGEPEWDPSVPRQGGADGAAPYGDATSGKVHAYNIGMQGYANGIQALKDA